MPLTQPNLPPDDLAAEARRTIASNVRAELGRRSISQSALAAALGLSQPVVSRRVRGEMAFDTDELVRTAAFLDVDLSVLLDGARSRCFSPLSLVSDMPGQMELAFDASPALELVTT